MHLGLGSTLTLHPSSAHSKGGLNPYLSEFVVVPLACSGGEARVSVCAVNCQDHPDLCELYNVTTYPSVLLHRGKGQWEKHYGILGAQQILEALVDSKVM